MGRLRPGFAAERLMHGAPCPIAIVPHGWQAGWGLNTLGVAFVESEAGARAATRRPRPDWVSRYLDLLICGSRGYGPLRAVLLGGRLAAEAHCPIIVLPRGVESPLESLVAEEPSAGAAGS